MEAEIININECRGVIREMKEKIAEAQREVVNLLHANMLATEGIDREESKVYQINGRGTQVGYRFIFHGTRTGAENFLDSVRKECVVRAMDFQIDGAEFKEHGKSNITINVPCEVDANIPNVQVKWP